MNTLLLRPLDVLFFRDGRPMEGGLAGDGASWPLPTVLDGALHAALHRSGIQSHVHRQQRNLIPDDEKRIRRYGDLKTAGPFPVDEKDTWYFPIPLDLDAGSGGIRITPFPDESARRWSSLPEPLRYSLRSVLSPKKHDRDVSWISSDGYTEYLEGKSVRKETLRADCDFLNREATVGIGMDADRGVQDGERFYSAHYMRLREGLRLGCFAEGRTEDGGNIVADLFPQYGRMIVGGQQRVCTVAFAPQTGQLAFPEGRRKDFTRSDGLGHLVKWVLLTPAIWPQMEQGNGLRRESTDRQKHPGGWLPNWVHASTGEVLLRSVSQEVRRKRRSLNASGKGYSSDHGNAPPIRAHLVSALVPGSIPVSGWALEHTEADRAAGPKTTHLAVPAGAVYYFSCDTAEDAVALANALNWHGDGDRSTIRRRRSTLFGEKGFGIGVCGTWSPQHSAALSSSAAGPA